MRCTFVSTRRTFPNLSILGPSPGWEPRKAETTFLRTGLNVQKDREREKPGTMATGLRGRWMSCKALTWSICSCSQEISLGSISRRKLVLELNTSIRAALVGVTEEQGGDGVEYEVHCFCSGEPGRVVE